MNPLWERIPVADLGEGISILDFCFGNHPFLEWMVTKLSQPWGSAIRLFDTRFQGPKFFSLINRNIQSAVSFFFSFFSLADSSLINIICFLLLFVPLVYFVLRASYLNLFFNVISQLIYYLIMISGQRRELMVINPYGFNLSFRARKTLLIVSHV